MEHRVKRRSEELMRLQKTVVLTASHFAAAVGVGKEKPFQFFQSLVEKNHTGGLKDVDDVWENAAPGHTGTTTESVIKEAYELLTGLRIQESGFWTPERGSPMHGLIGSLPDGLVVDPAEDTRVLGLATFKAPDDDLYTNSSSSQGGIPRHYMVQVQGQMAVCGAPWCDFMAVCSKTREIMLKRVFFQPRYWEHVSSRLRQFCFALQEAEIMRELGRDMTSGSMAKRLQKQSAQDQLFPAEDIITVQNLLRNTGHGTFRGPSRKLLSFDILVGDIYPLPPTLSKYSQELLARVDAEIRHKTPSKQRHGTLDQPEDEETEYICRRVFHGDAFVQEEEREPESPERVFGEGFGLFEGRNESLDSFEEEILMDETVNSAAVPVPDPQEVSVIEGTDSVLTGGDSATEPCKAVAETPSSSAAGKKDVMEKPLRGRGASSANTVSRGRARGARATGRGGNLRGVGSAGGNGRAAAPDTPAVQTVKGRGRGRGQDTNQSKVTPPAQRQPAPSTQSGAVKTQAVKTQPGSKVRMTSPVPKKIPRISSALRTGQSAARTPPKTQPQPAAATTAMTTTTTSSQDTTKVLTASGATEQGRESAKGGTLGQTKSNISSTQSAAPPTVSAVRSAKDEWEMSAKTRRQQARPPPGTPESEKSQSQPIVPTQAAFKQNSPAASASSGDGSRPGGVVTSDLEPEGTVTGEEDSDHWRMEVLGSGSDFVPPGLTLLGSGESETDRVSDLSPTKPPKGSETDRDSTSKRDQPAEGKYDSHIPPRQTLKRSLPQQDSSPAVEAKKTMQSGPPPSKSVDEAEVASGSGRERRLSQDRESPTKSQIHRPWLQGQEGRDQQSYRDENHAGGSFRSFDRVPEVRPRPFDTREGALSRSWGDRQDMGMHQGGRFPERGAPIRSLLDVDTVRGPSLMRRQFDRDFDRDSDQAKVFDYDHHRRIMAEDFHRRTNPGALQQSSLRQGTMPDLRTRDLDSLRRGLVRGPQDLSMHRAGMAGDGNRPLDRGIGGRGDSFGGRGHQLQGRWPQQAVRSDLESIRGLGLRAAHANLPVGQPVGAGNFPGAPRAFGAPVHPGDRSFAGLEARDLRPEWERAPMRGPSADFHGDRGRGQGFRGFPPGRRPFEF